MADQTLIGFPTGDLASLSGGDVPRWTGTAWGRGARQEFNVRDYGAVGDGASHPLSSRYATLGAAQAVYPFASALTQELDWAGTQAALNAANGGTSVHAEVAGGGGVHSPAGSYLISNTLVIYGGVHWYGDGPGGDVFSDTDANLPPRGTFVKLKGGANVDLLQTANFVSLSGGGDSSPYNIPNRFSVSSMTLDGNNYANTSGWVARIFGRSYWIDRVVFQNGASGGVFSDYTHNAGYDNEAQWSNFRITDCNTIGLDFQGPHDSSFTQGFVARVSGAGALGARFGAFIGTSMVTNVHVWGSMAYGWSLESANMSLVNCIADGCPVRVLAGGISWHGGSLYGTGAQGEFLVQLGDGTNTYTIKGVVFNTRWFTLGLGSLPLRYMDHVTPIRNAFTGPLAASTNIRYIGAQGKTSTVGAQTFTSGVTTSLNVDTATVASLPASGSVYIAPTGGTPFTINYTGLNTTSGAITGITGGVTNTVAAGTAVWEIATQPATETYYLYGETDANGVFQLGGVNGLPVYVEYPVRFVNTVVRYQVATSAQTVSVNGAVTLDLSLGETFLVTLAANATSMSITNATANQIFTVTFIQDSGGGHTYAWDTGCKFAGGSGPSDTTANKRSSVTFRADGGAGYWEVSRAVAVG